MSVFPAPHQLTISAASSLQTVLQTLELEFEQAYPHIDLTFNFAATGVLYRQIKQGTPVDVFLSAATQPINRLLEQQLITPHSLRSVVTNHLALIVPKQSQVALTGFHQLTDSQIQTIMVGERVSVPASQTHFIQAGFGLVPEQ